MPPSCIEVDGIRHSTPKKKSSYLSPLFDLNHKNQINKEINLSPTILSPELVSSTVIDDDDFGAELPELLIAQSDIELKILENNNNDKTNNKNITEAELNSMLSKSRNALNLIENMLRKMRRRKSNRNKTKLSKNNTVKFLFLI